MKKLKSLKERICQSFSQSAETYDDRPELHDHINYQLLSLLEGNFTRILDVGCGTGKLIAQLAQRYPQAKIIGLDLAPGMIKKAQKKHSNDKVRFIVGDGEALPFQADQFDLIVSSASLQWMSAGRAIPEAKRVLQPGGCFLFATFGPATLLELKQAGLAVNYFLDQERLRKILAENFEQVDMAAEKHFQEHPSIIDLLAYLRLIGANVRDLQVPHGLWTKRKLNALFSAKKELKVSYEIILGLARKTVL